MPGAMDAPPEALHKHMKVEVSSGWTGHQLDSVVQCIEVNESGSEACITDSTANGCKPEPVRLVHANKEGCVRTGKVELRVSFGSDAPRRFRVVALELDSTAEHLEVLIDDEYACSARGRPSSDATGASAALCTTTVSKKLRPGAVLVLRLVGPTDMNCFTVALLRLQVAAVAAAPPGQSFDLERVRERLQTGGVEVSPDAQSLMARLEQHRKTASSNGSGAPPGMGGMLAMMMAARAVASNAGATTQAKSSHVATRAPSDTAMESLQQSHLDASCSELGGTAASMAHLTGSSTSTSSNAASTQTIPAPRALEALENRLTARLDKLENKLDRLLELVPLCLTRK